MAVPLEMPEWTPKGPIRASRIQSIRLVDGALVLSLACGEEIADFSVQSRKIGDFVAMCADGTVLWLPAAAFMEVFQLGTGA